MIKPEGLLSCRRGAGRSDAILDVVVRLLAEVGYDRLTMDAVAAAAHAGKATLYRRWAGKAEMVADAIDHLDGAMAREAPDTGSLRGDMLALACDFDGYLDDRHMAVMSGMASVLPREPDLAQAFQERFVAPRKARVRAAFERARRRGEVAEGVDVELVAAVLPAMLVHRVLIGLGPADKDSIAAIVDGVVLPACAGPVSSPTRSAGVSVAARPSRGRAGQPADRAGTTLTPSRR
ncbi:MAG: TetR/AcrR family transcriptional regulator C-terminal ligand-binding domain-containing protein [Motilibacteraceae bacterium]